MLRYALIIMVAIGVIVASFFAARAITVSSLTNQNSVFDTFEDVDGTWLYSDRIGIAAASSVERARVAINGPLGLSPKEAVYFVALQDSDGEPLTSNCIYRVSGQPIDTRWWSLTVYDSVTQHYVPNAENRSSWNSVSTPRFESGNWVINVASIPQEEPWLPSQDAADQSFDLMLRVYNPSDATRAILPNIDLPVVERVSC